jgi:hypothetical protein
MGSGGIDIRAAVARRDAYRASLPAALPTEQTEAGRIAALPRWSPPTSPT